MSYTALIFDGNLLSTAKIIPDYFQVCCPKKNRYSGEGVNHQLRLTPCAPPCLPPPSAIQDQGEAELPLEGALHCILAAFRALQGPGRELQTDESAFVSALYRRIPDLLKPESGDASGRKTASCVALVYDCLDAALGKRRELSTTRVAAIVKRLMSVSLQLTQVRILNMVMFYTRFHTWTDNIFPQFMI